MKILALIPARMGSSRFPGKPLEKIYGMPMIGHVYERVKRCKLITETAVATCDDDIARYIESINGIAIMTSNKHERASDRCAEALLSIEKKKGVNYDIVVMVQGDEPMTHPAMLTEAIEPMIKDKTINVINLLGYIKDESEFYDKNCIKVVIDKNYNALYFSRQPIPNQNNKKYTKQNKQVCIIPFKRNFLLQYTELEPTELELLESIDMLRVLEHGMNVRMVRTFYETHAVDIKDDLIKVEKLLENDSLMNEYLTN